MSGALPDFADLIGATTGSQRQFRASLTHQAHYIPL
jgi:hypothetical protein